MTAVNYGEIIDSHRKLMEIAGKYNVPINDAERLLFY